ncbi:type I secretion system permease/ATPase [Mesorhizobium sp. M3A.F.Ca.ET.174.01.1.1]|nr:type I secretion system permease/ATPase [Mesorhizobium sp. WSM3876]RWB74388.1 MAG: type I secretion system permease/ATPase [Mesorhizobium sp.]TGS71921.1 type I secretion system permease/ATPase [Mesorhizobium sp. M3A.F.Ca.ET.201.01.1.1]TGS87595.1 type I secretion system permease/ATPase [Mesorhizobium sp. M3A.F.Ca.ET.175.01.1.1]TGT28054.1 type I secretion system permease/ATPase [Mesorhizobium sp. M3A.F.Ca.ET.174.01.1.1]
MRSSSPDLKPSELRRALTSFRGSYVAVAAFSGLINVLMLSGSLFMLQVYDRVLPSRSVPTLVALIVLVAVLYAFQGVLEAIRARVLTRIGAGIDETIANRVFDCVVRLPLRTRDRGEGLQALRDLDQISGFLSGPGPAALFDLPWMPLYVVICFLFHPWIGVAALIGALLLVSLTVLTDRLVRAPTKAMSGFGTKRGAIAQASARNAEVLAAMGMGARLAKSWSQANNAFREAQEQASDLTSGFGAASRILRMMLQSMVLALGAYLVIHQQATPGIIIASSILTSRALAPIELAIAHWKSFLNARQSWQRLDGLFAAFPISEGGMELPSPSSTLAVENISVVAPGGRRVVVEDIGFSLGAGSGIGLIGPSGSGKSSLARALVGVWPLMRGKIRFDGAALEQWPVDAVGRHIGYLPQDVELFAGTVGQNICRFDENASPETIIEAARAAGVHDMILHLPEGYQTEIGESGAALSAGQRQRVALARALFGKPFLVVLDEPNSNLDAAGDQALTRAIEGIKARGGIVIVVAHRPSALAALDHLLVLNGGRQQAFGLKSEIARQALQPVATPLHAVGSAG